MDKLTLSLVLFVAFCGKDVLCRTHAKKEDGGKIVGGNATTITNHPYQAYLMLYDGRDYYQCGGSIISNHSIVTAAHCLAGILEIYIRIGSTIANSGGLEYNATSFKSHPLYNAVTSDYDAAVVKVEGGMALDGSNARSISLVKSGYDVEDGQNIVLTGWGATAENGNITSELMVVEVPAVSRQRCNQLLTARVTRRMFCAGVPEGGKDTCQGDSGGPAVLAGDSDSGKLAGITSFGYGCARPNSPGVYTLIGNRSIRNFIRFLTGV